MYTLSSLNQPVFVLFKLALAKTHNFPIFQFSARFLSLVRRVCWLHVSGVLLSFPVLEKTISWFHKSTEIGPLGFEAWRVARGFFAQTLETYTHIFRAGSDSMVRGSQCNIRCLGTRDLVINPGWWTTGKCPHKALNPKDICLNRICAKSGVQNFRRRDACFKCSGPRTEFDANNEAEDEVAGPLQRYALATCTSYYIDLNLQVSTHPTNTVLLSGLDALTTEDAVRTHNIVKALFIIIIPGA